MNIEIDVNAILNFFYGILADFQNATYLEMINLILFKYWGVLFIIYVFIKYGIYPVWQYNTAVKWNSQFPEPVLLAIDVPKRNEQSILAMENMFDHLQGLHGTFPKWEKYIQCAYQRSLSLELVSIGGHIQFLIRCPGDWRNLVESAVYGQFPDAEVTEVEDYTKNIPSRYPDEKWDIWGVEMSLAGPDVQPIKSWRKFEHNFVDPLFVDPMAALLETMSSIGPNEQIWIQYILIPLAVDWGIKEGSEAVDKLLEKPVPPKPKSFTSSFLEEAGGLAGTFAEQLAGFGSGEGAKESKPEIRFPVMSTGTKDLIEGIENKTSQRAFDTKIRYVYIAEKGKLNKVIGVNGIIGSFKQWVDQSSNGPRPMLKQTSPSTPYYYLRDYRRNARKTIIMQAYKNRSTVVGIKPKPLCSEELASLWHFPSMNIRAPFLKTTDFRKTAAPSSLPVDQSPLRPVVADEAASPAEELAVMSEQEAVAPAVKFDYDSDEFEMQFAKDKSEFKKTRAQRNKRLKEINAEETEKMKKLWDQQGSVQLNQTKEPAATKEPAPKAQKTVTKTTLPSSSPGGRRSISNLPFID